ncbi:amidohydrolase family protein [Sulfitobacter sp. F26169L]|uniref:amidohydrolase family protein n=1 Tax=Sulfitobacter sp. F26169L TaxID=2996015 RepID=UPI002260C64C|nr:amidohydrolase family protein [Sulfitobacter sp. F26169L]MCX7568121.1 amidohydrolase family protein [Sulfitobacter sp. F26169L]
MMGPDAQLTGVRLGGADDVVDLRLSGGKIAALTPSAAPAATLILPLMADAHVHLDKTFTTRRTGAGAVSLFDAIERMQADKSNWTADDLYARASLAMEKAYRHGVAAMRTHVDWNTAEVPVAWGVMDDLAREWRGRVDLQLASLSPIDLLAESGEQIAAHVRKTGGVFGAFIYRNDGLADKVADVFALSDAHDLPLDFHVDEGLESEAQGFDLIVDQAAQRRDGPSVLCGHACSLSVRPQDEVKAVLERAAAAQVGLVVLPTTNSYLQDNAPDRTPRLRGIAPMKEAALAGVDVIIASDNVCDVFFPYGDYDLFDVYRGGVHLAQLEPAAWIDAITQGAARWCDGAAVTPLTVGAPANFIAVQASDLHDAISRPSAVRHIYRNGEILA